MIQARANAAAKARKDIDKAFLNYDFSKYKITPLWDLAIVHKNKKSVEVPYTVEGKLIMPSVSKTLKGRQRLLLTLEKSKVSVMIIQYVPDLEFVGKITDINAENFKSQKFSGRVVFQSLGENTSSVWYLEKGKVNKKMTRSKANRGLKVRDYVFCETFCQDTDWYQLIGGEWYYTGTTTECWEECEYIVETPPYDPYDCNNDSSWPWCDNGNGGGGGDPCGNNNGRTNCAECNDMASYANAEVTAVGTEIEFEELDNDGDTKHARYKIHVATHPVFELYSNVKATMVPNGSTGWWMFSQIEVGNAFLYIKQGDITCTANVVGDFDNNLNHAILHYDGNVQVTFPLSVTCGIPPFEGTVGPFTRTVNIVNFTAQINAK